METKRETGFIVRFSEREMLCMIRAAQYTLDKCANFLRFSVIDRKILENMTFIKI